MDIIIIKIKFLTMAVIVIAITAIVLKVISDYDM